MKVEMKIDESFVLGAFTTASLPYSICYALKYFTKKPQYSYYEQITFVVYTLIEIYNRFCRGIVTWFGQIYFESLSLTYRVF